MRVRKVLLILLLISPILMIDCTTPTGAQDFFMYLDGMVGAGNPPDVVYMDALWTPEYVSRGLLQPIPGELDLDAFYPELLPYFQRDENGLPCSGSSEICHTYALPHNVQTVALVVNGDLFKSAELDYPDEWENYDWEAFRGMAETIVANTDAHGVALTPGFWNFLPFLFQADAALFDDSRTTLMLTTDQAEDALTFYTNLYIDGLAFRPEGEWPHWGAYDEMLYAFADNRVGMFLGGPSMYDDVLARMELDPSSQEMVKVFELPKGPGGTQATIGEIRGFGLMSQPGEEPSEAAVTFLRFITSEEGMRSWIGDYNTPSDYMPARPSLEDDWKEVHPNTEAFVAGVDYLYSYQPALASIEAVEEFDKIAGASIGDALDGDPTAKETLKQLQIEGNDILEKGRPD